MAKSKIIDNLSNLPDKNIYKLLHKTEHYSLIITLFIASIILLAWLFPPIRGFFPSFWSEMKANTALAILTATLSLIPLIEADKASLKILRRILITITLVLSTTAFYEHVTHAETLLDTFIAKDENSLHPGLMSLQSSLFLITLSLLLFIPYYRQDNISIIFDTINMILILFVLVLFSGYIFDASDLVGQSSYIKTSPQTLLCFALLTIIISSRRANFGILSILLGAGTGSIFARRIMPAMLLSAFAIILIGAKLIASGTLNVAYAAALMALGLTTLLIFVIILLARQINKLDAEVRAASLIDELTLVNNRRGLYLLGEHSLQNSRRMMKSSTVFFFDVNGLKKINDTQGHNIGSELIYDVARLLVTTFRNTDVIGRLGGDEFAAIIQGTEIEAAHLLDRLDKAIEQSNQSENKPYWISISIGHVTSQPKDKDSLDDLLSRADKCMYENKRKHYIAENTMINDSYELKKQ